MLKPIAHTSTSCAQSASCTPHPTIHSLLSATQALSKEVAQGTAGLLMAPGQQPAQSGKRTDVHLRQATVNGHHATQAAG